MFIVENQHIEGVTHLYQCQNILQGTLYSLSFRVCVCVCVKFLVQFRLCWLSTDRFKTYNTLYS